MSDKCRANIGRKDLLFPFRSDRLTIAAFVLTDSLYNQQPLLQFRFHHLISRTKADSLFSRSLCALSLTS